MAAKRRARRASDEGIRDVTEQVVALASMTVSQLADAHLEVFGVATRSRNRQFLVKRIAWRVQEQAEGGLSRAAEAKIEELAPAAPARWNRPAGSIPDRDPRLPRPGTVLTREYKGTTHEVKVLADGFEYDGARFGSLSTIAKRITGTEWSGLVFFGLKARAKKGAAA
jgi:hypothetical protein